MTTSPTDRRLARLALAGLTAVALAAMAFRVAEASSSSPVPPGATEDQVQAGAHLFQTSTCNSCHGTDAHGTEQGPDLGSGHWLWSGGDLAGLRGTIAQGVAQPKQYGGPMPPMGGAQLSQQDVDALAAYVWSVGHAGR
ncbi:MAG TPA: c-type cytochrome [Caulobacteraceae bacterium]